MPDEVLDEQTVPETDEVPMVLISNLKIGGRGPFWLNVPYFDNLTYSGSDWYINTGIKLATEGMQLVVSAPTILTESTRLIWQNQSATVLNASSIVCNNGGLSPAAYPAESRVHLVYDGSKWIVLN